MALQTILASLLTPLCVNHMSICRLYLLADQLLGCRRSAACLLQCVLDLPALLLLALVPPALASPCKQQRLRTIEDEYAGHAYHSGTHSRASSCRFLKTSQLCRMSPSLLRHTQPYLCRDSPILSTQLATVIHVRSRNQKALGVQQHQWSHRIRCM